MSLDYAWEKFYKAVYSAVASESPLQQRLAAVYAYNIVHLKTEDLPPEFRDRFDALRLAMTSTPATGNEGSINASTAIMSTAEAGELLEEIVSIFNGICEEKATKG